MQAHAAGVKDERADCALRVSSLTKRFGDVTAVDRLSIEVRRDEILGFLGPNKIPSFGAGLGGVTFELAVILMLTTVYFAIGAWPFGRQHQMV